jgi:Putative Actinobacterial Holin-X, holin superfamily III
VQETHANGKSASARGLIASVVGDAQRLVALEVALAKQELKELATANAIAAAVIALGGLLIVLGVLVAGPVLVITLVGWSWEAAATWVAAYIVLGLVLVVVGKSRLQLRPPPRTLESLKENKEWVLRHVRSNSK